MHMFGIETVWEILESENGPLLRLLKESTYVTDIFEVILSTVQYSAEAQFEINPIDGLQSIVGIIAQNGLGWCASTMYKASRI